ncbi:MAG TPA: Spy/CpxP family protein refolding chaperone [Tepidisphaeraceae bacterium]|nr:Spy/CpxP family protein refolding chaperone [Tepidisphaeraceae bacterium]
MRGLKLAILLGFACMFVAGIAVGRGHKPTPTVKPAHTSGPQSWMADQLHLTPIQQDQMKKIWSDAMAHRPDLSPQFHQADQQRKDAIRGLLSDGQEAKYQQILKDHDAKIAQLRGQAEKPLRDAEDETRKILRPDQLPKFEEIVKQHAHRHGGPPRFHRGPRPATAPQHDRPPT